eukprot:gnl/Chilomastix_cuspidata/3703.p2 GENE.gnl/Chilomastix_cuspidata/3703~~gnl/Chilomastix_cuspidata/3703.p2  ORF type:complete len:143 (+),score=28.35 gnl/Chilomastix_cuspidata/3703:33-461(+)
MSFVLNHLHSGYAVDQAITHEEDRVVVIRFGRDYDPYCMAMDHHLAKIAPLVVNMAIIYVVDVDEVTDFTLMYELYDPCSVMFFFRNRHILVDFGTGNNNKINFPIKSKQELIDVIEQVYRGATKGKGLVVSERNYSTREKW